MEGCIKTLFNVYSTKAADVKIVQSFVKLEYVRANTVLRNMSLQKAYL